MSGIFEGRIVVVSRSGSNVAGARVKGLKLNGSPIDATNDDDAGIRQLLAAPGQLDISITVSGLLINDRLVQEALSADSRAALTNFSMPAAAFSSPKASTTITGQFVMTSFEITGEYQGAMTFAAEFQSQGLVSISLFG